MALAHGKSLVLSQANQENNVPKSPAVLAPTALRHGKKRLLTPANQVKVRAEVPRGAGANGTGTRTKPSPNTSKSRNSTRINKPPAVLAPTALWHGKIRVLTQAIQEKVRA
jgi:hypothetical protein